MKKHMFLMMALFFCAVPSLKAYEYFTIYYQDGTKSAAFYATDVDSIRYSKIGLDSLTYDTWQVQEIWMVDSTYRIPLADINHIDFTDVDEKKVAEDMANISVAILPIYAKCNSTDEIAQYLTTILNINGVENAWTDNQSLFVKMKDYGIMTFSYPPAEEKVINENPLARKTQGVTLPQYTSEHRACIVNQMSNDASRKRPSNASSKLKKKFDEMGIDCYIENKPMAHFFNTGIFDYDLVFIMTHGEYDGYTHWLYTGEELFSTEAGHEESDYIKLDSIAYNLLKKKYPQYSSNMLSVAWLSEIRGGSKVIVWYIKVSEHYIAKADRDYKGKNASIFNLACQSLKENENLGKIFLEKGAKCYLGYNEINRIGAEGGESFFNNLMNGKCADVAWRTIPSDWCIETLKNGTTSTLILLPQKSKETLNYFITPPTTLPAEIDGGTIKIKGKIKILDSHGEEAQNNKYSFLYSESPNMINSKTVKEEIIHDESSHDVVIEHTFKEEDLKPSTIYYYQAYMYDGLSYCYGEVKEFTKPVPYAVIKNDTITFYYDGKQKERKGEVCEVNEYGQFDLSSGKGCEHARFDFSFANYAPQKTSYWFSGYGNLKSIEGFSNLNTSNVTDMGGMFYECSSLTSLDLSSFDTSNVMYMYNMFTGCSSLASLDVSHFNTSNVTNMAAMFSDCSSLTSIDVSHFDTSNVTNMRGMFSSCSSLTSLDLSHLDTSHVTDMSWMFYSCPSLTSLDVSNIDTSNVTDMSHMFVGDSLLTSLDVNNFDTSNVTNMHGMFSDCSSLTSLDVSKFKTANATDMAGMFSRCSSLISLDVSHFYTSNVQSMNSMFYRCSSLTSLDVSNFDTSNVTTMGYMFRGCSSLISLDVSHFDTSNVTDKAYMFSECLSLTSLNVSNFDLSNMTAEEERDWFHSFTVSHSLTTLNISNLNAPNVTNMNYMFLHASSLTSIDMSNLNAPNVTDMGRMFSNCYALTSVNMSNLNAPNVTNMSCMFSGCSSLTSVNMGNLNAPNVTNMSCMFSGCSSLTSVNMGNLNAPNVTNMSCMFSGCSALTPLDLSSFNTSNVTNMSEIFSDCSSLTSLDLSNFDTSNVTNMRYMFGGCSSLKTIYANDWDYIGDSGEMFAGCNNLEGGEGTKIGKNLYGYDADGDPLYYYYWKDDASAAHIDGGKDNPGLFTAK